MLEADGFIESNGGCEGSVGFEIEAGGAGSAGFGDHLFEQEPSNAGSAQGFGDGHFGYFELAGRHYEQGATAYGLGISNRKKDAAAVIEDSLARIGESGFIFGFDGKVAANPLFIQLTESCFVIIIAGNEFANGQFRVHNK